MTTTLDRSDVLEQIHADAKGKWDKKHRVTNLALRAGRLSVEGDGEQGDEFELNAWSSGQLCQQLGIPAAYFRRCPVELQDAQANFWLQDLIARREVDSGPRSNGPLKWLLRGKNDQVRGILSERYARLDNLDLVPILEPFLNDGFSIAGFSLTDVSFHLRLIRPSSRRLIRLGDEAMAGIHISNSEVGLRALTVDALVYRLVCTNGLIRTVNGKNHLHQRHIGIADAALADRFQSAAQSALDAANSGVEAFAHSVSITVEDPEEVITRFADRHDLTDEFAKTVLMRLAQEPAAIQSTQYGVINALTSAAQLKESPDDRYRIEQLAGSLLN